ncbi:MAG: hypothetical protein V4591_02465, partial [Bdellovibrionota bacterium]
MSVVGLRNPWNIMTTFSGKATEYPVDGALEKLLFAAEQFGSNEPGSHKRKRDAEEEYLCSTNPESETEEWLRDSEPLSKRVRILGEMEFKDALQSICDCLQSPDGNLMDTLVLLNGLCQQSQIENDLSLFYNVLVECYLSEAIAEIASEFVTTTEHLDPNLKKFLTNLVFEICSKNGILPIGDLDTNLVSVLGFQALEIKYSSGETPKKISDFPDCSIVGTGDTHGNTLRIITDLVKTGMIKELSEDVYNELSEIIEEASNEELTFESYNNFKWILSEYLEVLNKETLYLLFGDILSDRQSNDILTLALLNELDNKDLNFEILLSNHDLNFIRRYLAGDSGMNEEISSSMHKMYKFFETLDPEKSGKIQGDLKKFVEKVYFPKLRLFKYVENSKIFLCH